MLASRQPAPDLYRHAAARMGVAPADCLGLEDSLNGIRAARAAGMTCWRFTGGSHLIGLDLDEPEDARPDRSVATFDEMFHADPDLAGDAR
jgi:beta-phosphoglucomutase-like phosphatase (HAD superfamily)